MVPDEASDVVAGHLTFTVGYNQKSILLGDFYFNSGGYLRVYFF